MEPRGALPGRLAMNTIAVATSPEVGEEDEAEFSE
jgi:hypothetical protein